MEKHRQILRAARQVAAREGFHQATMQKIAAEAGLKSPSHIYWYFKNKKELFEAMMEELSPILSQLPNLWSRIDDSPEEVLLFIGKAYLKTFDNPEARQLFRIFFSEVTREQETANSFAEKAVLLLNFLVTYLEHQIEIGKKAGKSNITWKIAKLDLPALPDERVDQLVQMVKEKATVLKEALNDEQFIELYNSNPYFEDLSGWQLGGDVAFVFPEGTHLAGHSFLVVAAVPEDLRQVHGLAEVWGGWGGSLPAEGGTIRLCKRSGAIVLGIHYAATPSWPVASAGTGH